MPKYVYIHIPFCKSKCRYCSFVSFNKPEFINEYIAALRKEIQTYYNGEMLATLYFGGGTPSLIVAHLISEILNEFNFSPDCEITLELNPDDANEKYLTEIHSLGVNRLSIGAQTFEDKILQLAGRRHTSADILNAVRIAQKAGFNNISTDLIYGLPQQSLQFLNKDLEKILLLGIQHISTYGLKIEAESYWGKNPPAELPDDDEQAVMYEKIHQVLEQSGFKRYEISNYSLKGYESKHNLNYWNNNEYYGFGVSAHGYVNGIRYSNTSVLEKYINKPEIRNCEHIVTNKERLEEEIFLGLRKTEGLNIIKINNNYHINFEQKYKRVLNKYSDFFIKTQYGYALNQNGFLLSNVILADFLE